jgi:hypothetical protein
MELIPAGDPDDVHLAIVERFNQRLTIPSPDAEVETAVIA